MKKILIQLDTDVQASSFDRVVAVDAGVDELFSYDSITPQNVTGLVHGAMFTRGPADLKNTAIFVGGSQARDGEALLEAVRSTFFGPMRVSVMMDSNGCNTTAAAAVVAAKKHLPLKKCRAVVLGGTGPVGQRVAELLAFEGSCVTVVSRSRERAAEVCATIRAKDASECGELVPAAAGHSDEFLAACQGQQLIVACGAAGICFLPTDTLSQLTDLAVAIDLNAVPPVGLADVSPMDRAVQKGSVLCYGALGVGGTKMKVHKRAVASLFERNDAVLDTNEIYRLALEVSGIQG
ncbi:MAG: NAD(P)-dependent methylenetetrahydromethanopterin dehydrogenase [Planctomycetaceae bacterium]